MNWVLYPEVFSILIAVLAMVIVLALAFIYGTYHRVAWTQLPAATRNAELAILIKQRETELLDKEQRLERLGEQFRDREAKLLERDQLEAEAAYWKSQIEAAKAEYAGLDLLRAETEEVREAFRQEMESLADAERQVREAKGNLEEMQIRLAEAERRLAEIANEDSSLRERLQGLVQAVDETEAKLTTKKAEYATVTESVERAHDRVAKMEREVEALEAQQRLLHAEIHRDQDRLKTVNTELDNLEPIRQDLATARNELDDAKQNLKEKYETLSRLKSDEAWLNTQIVSKREELDEATGDSDSALTDLLKPPVCLASEESDGNYTAVLPNQQPVEQEWKALQRVQEHLKECGLVFDHRVIRAFHTSLKTAVISPLTVLAGVSGTGKSQLPRFYADAMGMHFLKIPVQPRWDGPQDLFGFYNYIEKRYKATDLSRALIHLDRYNWPDQAARFAERVLLVLMDEMNLARVEYYFSEFLSRLEGRPLDKNADNDGVRRPSEIEIDVSRVGQTRRVYAGQNILFVGTMNEDESTLSLSDKVLDRANMLCFPRPRELESNIPTVSNRQIIEGYLPQSRWTQDWMRSVEDMDDDARRRTSQMVSDINAIMDKMGRPFGHRMGQTMLHYVANYPSDQDPTDNLERTALADQVELRILPRLRGVLVDEHRSRLDDLARFVLESLKDKPLSDAIYDAIRRSRDTNGLFIWRGFIRQ